jgi:hypothetical protein
VLAGKGLERDNFDLSNKTVSDHVVFYHAQREGDRHGNSLAEKWTGHRFAHAKSTAKRTGISPPMQKAQQKDRHLSLGICFLTTKLSLARRGW